jgi:hypothetical protein
MTEELCAMVWLLKRQEEAEVFVVTVTVAWQVAVPAIPVNIPV